MKDYRLDVPGFESVTISREEDWSGDAIVEWFSEKGGRHVASIPAVILMCAGLDPVKRLVASELAKSATQIIKTLDLFAHEEEI